MNKLALKEKRVRNTLGILLLFLAVNAFGGGYYGISGAKGIPVEWLKDSPFNNYFVPGLILFICVGGSALVAAIFVFKQHSYARTVAFCCGTVVAVWLIAQVAIIGYVSWLQPAIAVLGISILLLTQQIPKNR